MMDATLTHSGMEATTHFAPHRTVTGWLTAPGEKAHIVAFTLNPSGTSNS